MHNGSKKIVNICERFGSMKRIYDCGSRDALDGIHLANALQAEELHVFEPNPESARVCRENLNSSNSYKTLTNTRNKDNV